MPRLPSDLRIRLRMKWTMKKAGKSALFNPMFNIVVRALRYSIRARVECPMISNMTTTSLR